MRRFILAALAACVVVCAWATMPTVTVTLDCANPDGTFPATAPYATAQVTWTQSGDPAVHTQAVSPAYDATTGKLTWTVPQNSQVKVNCPSYGYSALTFAIGTSNVLLNSVAPATPAPAPSWFPAYTSADIGKQLKVGTGPILEWGASSLTFSQPLVNTGGTVSIPKATAAADGYLASADFSAFAAKGNASYPTPDAAGWWHSNGSGTYAWSTPSAADVGAEPAIAAGTTAQYWRGDKTWQTLPAATPGGSPGAIQGNIAGAFAAVPGAAFDTSTGAITLTAGAATTTPLVIKANAAQSALLFQIGNSTWTTNLFSVNSSGTVSFPGTLSCGPILTNNSVGARPGLDLTLRADSNGGSGKAIRLQYSPGVGWMDAITVTNPTGLVTFGSGGVQFATLPPIYANNAAAVAGGLAAGQTYRTGADPDVLCVVH